MDFALTQDQLDLKKAARDFLERESSPSTVRSVYDGIDPTAEVWKKCAALGWGGLLIEESLGGAGLGWIEATLVAEEAGRAVLPAPLVETLLVTACIQMGAESDRQGEFLSKIAAGAPATVAVREGRYEDVNTKAVQRNGSYEIDGTKKLVAHGDKAEILAVSALVEGAAACLIVEVDECVKSTKLGASDATRPQSSVNLQSAKGYLLNGNIPQLIVDRGCLLVAAEQTGLARKCLEMSVEHAKSRKQFGKQIGVYQAVSHKIANMYMLVEHATSLTWYAAWAASVDSPDAATAAWRAKVMASRAANAATKDAIQIHGGMGFTYETDFHFYLRRAKSNEFFPVDTAACIEMIANAAH